MRDSLRELYDFIDLAMARTRVDDLSNAVMRMQSLINEIYAECGEDKRTAELCRATLEIARNQVGMSNNDMNDDKPLNMEPRPNPEWFELTKPENKDPGISESQFWESLGETNMNDETLTGSALMRAIADAMDAGDGPGGFEYWVEVRNKWNTATSWSGLIKLDFDNYEIRRKPTTHTVTLESGERVNVPKPMRQAPKHDADCWLLFDDEDRERPGYWHDDNDDRAWLRAGRLYASREARDQAERALTRILTEGAA